MTTLTIEIPAKVEKTLSDLVQQLGGKVIKAESQKSSKTTEKLSRSEKAFLKGLDEAVEFAKGCPVLQGDGNTVEVRQIARRDGVHS